MLFLTHLLITIWVQSTVIFCSCKVYGASEHTLFNLLQNWIMTLWKHAFFGEITQKYFGAVRPDVSKKKKNSKIITRWQKPKQNNFLRDNHFVPVQELVPFLGPPYFGVATLLLSRKSRNRYLRNNGKRNGILARPKIISLDSNVLETEKSLYSPFIINLTFF